MTVPSEPRTGEGLFTGEDRAPRVLLVDDEEKILALFRRYLTSTGWQVLCARGGPEAKAILESDTFDVIVSDISMPGTDGIQLLRIVRQHDLDVPVVLVTGSPELATAVRALELGAFRYLVKPLLPSQLIEVISYAKRVHDLARLKREALELLGKRARAASDRAGLEAAFGEMMRSLWMEYQPIYSAVRGGVYGYEALLRSSVDSLKQPTEVVRAAERLGRLHALGRAVRERVVEAIPKLEPDQILFVNLHPLELEDDELYSSGSPLTPHARRVVLEITEKAPIDDVSALSERVARLRSMGFRLAIDDLGAGFAGLSTFAQLSPDLVKIDLALIQQIDREPVKQRLVKSMLELCASMAIPVVAEGVETDAERATLVRLGADLLQGYRLGRPRRELLCA